VDELSAEAITGLCVVDPPDPFAPDPEVAARLRLAHSNPADPATIEFLPLADAPFLDCEGAGTQGLGLAGPGRLGGAITAFSPIAAVDPLSGGPEPLVISLDLPATISSTPGSSIVGTVEFADPDADVARVFVDVLSGPASPFDFDPQVRGEDMGSFQFNIFCPPEGDPCGTGDVQATLTIEDARQNRSQPFPFGYTVVAP
jgi:hypothetical protein